MRLVLSLVMALLLASVSVAQETVITTANAARLSQVAVLGHGQANDLAFTPNGKLLAVATSIGVLVTETRAPDATERMAGSEFYAVTVAINPAGTRVAAGGWDYSLRVWDLATGEPLLESRDHQAGVSAITFSPDGATLASAGDDLSVRLWDADKLSVRAIISGVPARTNALAFSPDSTLLAGADDTGTVHLWDVAAGTEVAALTGHTTAARTLVFLPDGTLVSADDIGRIILWDVASRAQRLTLDNAEIPVQDMALSPDGLLLTVGGDEILRGRMLPENAPAYERVNEPRHPLQAVAAAPGGIVATASAQEISIWDAEHQEPISRLWMPDKAYSVAYSADGRSLAIGSTDGHITFYNTDTLAPRAALQIGRGTPTALVFLADGRLVAGMEDGTLVVIGPLGEHVIAEWPVHQGAVAGLATPGDDGVLVISAGRDATVAFTNVVTGEGTERERGENAVFNSLAVDPTNRRLVTASDAGVLTLFEIGNRRPRNGAKLKLDDDVIPLAVALSDNGRTLAVGASDGAVRFVTVPALALETVLPVFFGPVSDLAYAPDGSWLAAVSYDLSLRVIDSQTRAVIFEALAHTDSILGLAIHPDATRIVTVAEDGVARVWAIQ